SQIKVLDLGLAVITDAPRVTELTQDGAIMGTPAYMAPEQGLNARQANARSDVYSLGCALQHLVTGKPPFDGGTALQVLAAHLHTEPPPLRQFSHDASPELEAVVKRMLAKKPEDRFQTMADVAAALAPLVPASSGRAPARRPTQPSGARPQV